MLWPLSVPICVFGHSAVIVLTVFFFSRLWRRAEVVTDVELTPLNGSGPVEEHKFLALSLRHLVFAVPLDEHAA